jgi:hypothetical protein
LQLKHKQTGKIYDIKAGRILDPKSARKADTRASFISVQEHNGTECLGILVSYTPDGFYSNKNDFEILYQGENYDS